MLVQIRFWVMLRAVERCEIKFKLCHGYFFQPTIRPTPTLAPTRHSEGPRTIRYHNYCFARKKWRILLFFNPKIVLTFTRHNIELIISIRIFIFYSIFLHTSSSTNNNKINNKKKIIKQENGTMVPNLSNKFKFDLIHHHLVLQHQPYYA